MITTEILRRLPKAELHCHLDGSLRAATLLELSREHGLPLPADDEESLAAHMHMQDARHLEDYLARFALTIAALQTEEALERAAYELAEDVARDGVTYLEVRNSPVLNTRGGLSLGAALEAPMRGFARAERDFGITIRFIVCALRDLPPEVSLQLARLAVDYRERGVVAFDLAGAEAGHPASAHAAAFRYARENDLPVTVHAGEGDGAASVREAVHACCANRLGHATRLIEDPALTQYVNDRRIALEICLTSNVHTRVADSYESHPLRNYFDRGMVVTLNTDNRLMSATTLTDEFVHAARHLDFTWSELCEVALNGFASAFVPWEERRRLIDDARARIAALSNPAAARTAS